MCGFAGCSIVEFTVVPSWVNFHMPLALVCIVANTRAVCGVSSATKIYAMQDCSAPLIGEAIVYTLRLDAFDADAIAQMRSVLSRDELARADRYLLDAPRRRFIVCRSYLRQLLATMLGESAEAISFQYERSGKPSLRGGTGLHFNISHSQDCALLAVAQQPLGVDIEIPDARLRMSSLIRQVLSSSELDATSGMSAAVLDCLTLDLWVCKEAVLKALGIGLKAGMGSVSFQLPLVNGSEWFAPQRIDPALQMELEESGSCARNNWLDANAWRLCFLTAPAGGRAAIAVPRSIERLEFREPV